MNYDGTHSEVTEMTKTIKTPKEPKKLTKAQKNAANVVMVEAGKALEKQDKKIVAGKPKAAKAPKQKAAEPTTESPTIAKVRSMCTDRGLSALTTKDACSRVKALMAKYPEPPTDEQLKSDLTVAKKNNALWALRLWRAAVA
jgi:hypothetical protein